MAQRMFPPQTHCTCALFPVGWMLDVGLGDDGKDYVRDDG